MKKVLLLFAMVPFLCAFNYQMFPDLTDKDPANSAYWDEKNIYWQIFDIDGDDLADVALGYQPNYAVPLVIMTPIGMQIVWQVDIDGVSITYYWIDLDSNGLPFAADDYDWAEILHDPEGDGLNGNEEVPFKVEKETSI